MRKPIHPKVAAAGLAAAIVTLVNAALFQFTGYDPTPVEVGAEVTVAAYLTGYLKSS